MQCMGHGKMELVRGKWARVPGVGKKPFDLAWIPFQLWFFGLILILLTPPGVVSVLLVAFCL